MKRHFASLILVLGLVLAAITVAAVTPSNAFQQVVVPYAYVGDGWDSVLVISNISGEVINPYVLVRNGDVAACTRVGELEDGEIYVSTFSAISGWCFSLTPPFPGVFQVYVGSVELESEDEPFGVSVAINNALFGGFGFQQFKSESASTPAIYLACACM